MVKDIVVNLGLGARDHVGVYAISVAEAFEAHLLGAAVSYEPVIPGNTLGGIPPETFGVQYHESENKARAAIDRFEQAAKREGLSYETRILTTSIAGAADQLGRIGRRFDLMFSVSRREKPQTMSSTKPCCSNPVGRSSWCLSSKKVG
jgi:hypothetical protein